MQAEILTVGDELLIGQVVNTNAAWLGERLGAAGVDVVRVVSVGDDVGAIERELADAFERVSFVLVTGGLGPTHDDVTKDALGAFFGVPLRFDEAVFAAIADRFARRGRSLPERNRVQAFVPEGFTVLPNPRGTAPGLWFEDEAQGRPRRLAVVPGVPSEMKGLVEEEVLPRLHDAADLRVIEHRTLHTAGIGESHLQEVVGDLGDVLGPSLRLAYLPSTNGVRLRLTAHGTDRGEVAARLDALEARIRSRAGRFVYGVDGAELEAVVGALLRERGLTLAVAESCTGGFLSHRLTNVSGSSGYLVGGIVAYSNAVKVGQLGVDAEVLEAQGAVSEAVALQMARGVRALLGADVGLSTTGIAGPTGGTPDKPVGTVWIGYADADGERAVHLRLVHDRLLNKELTVTAVLDLVRRRLGSVE